MAGRNHHSIGEVLSLLQDDFPDITISKIRFLESQGLINPERTPSGYRRFFARDLERLRWILTQQRDHYLPLKVIREKLAAGEPLDVEPPAATAEQPASGAAPSEEPAPVEPSPTGDAEQPSVTPPPHPAPEPMASTAEGASEPSMVHAPEPAGETAPPSSPQATVVSEDEDEDATEGGTRRAAGDARVEGAAPDEPAAAGVPVPGASPGEAARTDAGPSAQSGDLVEVLEASEAVGASEPGEPSGPGASTGEAAGDSEPAGGPSSRVDDDGEAEGGAGESPADLFGPVDEANPALTEEAPAGPAGRQSSGRSKQRRSQASKTGPAWSTEGGGAAEAAEPAVGTAAVIPEGGDVPATRRRPGREAVTPDDGGSAPASDQPSTRRPAGSTHPVVEEPVVVALTRDELAEASGCPVPVLNDLERFGLLQGKAVGRGVLYDGDALVVARLAARFANHGLEPRHLRSFRLAAEREMGLFAQVVGPLLQRRDAMAHERAMETLTDLAGLASELHQVLVQNLVSREFGSR